MHLLIKHFAEKKYLEEFSSGSLYMNTLDYFWNNGFDEQNDMFEGVVCTVPVYSIKEIPPGWRFMQACDYRFRAEGYRYCNVLCFEKIGFSFEGGIINVQISKTMSKFGNFIAVIRDENEFIKRIEQSVKKNGYKFLCGEVHYHMLKKDGIPTSEGNQVIFRVDNKLFDIDSVRKEYNNVTNRDCFDKSDQYFSQREWRIALYRGVKDINAYRMEIGDLSDIMTVCECDNFYETIMEVLSQYGLNENDCYYGNMSRRKLKELFCRLGDNKASLFTTIGGA